MTIEKVFDRFTCKTCVLRDSNNRCHQGPPQLSRKMMGGELGLPAVSVVAWEQPLVSHDGYCYQYVPIPTIEKIKEYEDA